MKIIGVTEPEPDVGEVKVRVLECGICGTGDEVYNGLIRPAPKRSEYLIIGTRILEICGKISCGHSGKLTAYTRKRML